MKISASISVILIVFIIVIAFSPVLKSIPDPYCSSGTRWLEENPHISIETGQGSLILAKPSSSVIVYALGIITTAAGIYFYRHRSGSEAKKWWGIALILWGIGTFFAGTSYQAFAYEIKCTESYCSFTSWFEIVYMMFEVLSINAILIAVSKSLWSPAGQRIAAVYSAANSIIYAAALTAGSYIPFKELILFETMLLFAAPAMIAIFIASIKAALIQKDKLGRSLALACLILLVVMILYYWYLTAGLTQTVWETGFWFSSNDVLHIGLIAWMIYLVRGLFPNLD